MQNTSQQPRVILDPLVHREAKIACVQDNISMTDKGNELFRLWLKSRASGKKPFGRRDAK